MLYAGTVFAESKYKLLWRFCVVYRMGNCQRKLGELVGAYTNEFDLLLFPHTRQGEVSFRTLCAGLACILNSDPLRFHSIHLLETNRSNLKRSLHFQRFFNYDSSPNLFLPNR